MVVGVVLDGQGRPICCELWPGNTADVTTLIPVIDRLKRRFHIESICVVADRGMISRDTIEKLQAVHRNTRYLLGARLRAVQEIYEEVLSRAGRYHEVYGPKQQSKDPAPLKVKEVWVEDQRYIVCHHEDQAKKDAADREAIVASLRARLRDDLDALEEITVHTRGRSFVLRSPVQGDAGKALQAVGVALGPMVRLEDTGPPSESPRRDGRRSAKAAPR
jgi:transposase